MIIEGVVVKGRSLGHTLGFPTANIELTAEIDIIEGVYQSQVEINGKSYRGVSNLGSNPTVGGDRRKLETYILDFNKDIYGQNIKVELLNRLRGEIRFKSIEDLREQIIKDVETVKNKQ